MISTGSYDLIKWFLPVILLLNPRYNRCLIFRSFGKRKNVQVIIGLYNHGRNVRRRTNGMGKKHIMESHKQPRCLYCSTALLFNNISVDHIIPISKGGTNSKYNIINNCCGTCNKERGSSEFYEFLYKKRPDMKLLKYPVV